MRAIAWNSSRISVIFLAALVVSGRTGRADPIDGVVGVQGVMANQLTSPGKGSRFLGQLEFARLSRWTSVTLKGGSGQSYSDYGGALRFFKHLYFRDPNRYGTGISLGLGGGAAFSSGYQSRITGFDAYFDPAGKKRSFLEIQLTPFARFLWDFGVDYGMSLELGYEFVPKRAFLEGGPSFDQKTRGRFLVTLGAVVGM